MAWHRILYNVEGCFTWSVDDEPHARSQTDGYLIAALKPHYAGIHRIVHRVVHDQYGFFGVFVRSSQKEDLRQQVERLLLDYARMVGEVIHPKGLETIK